MKNFFSIRLVTTHILSSARGPKWIDLQASRSCIISKLFPILIIVPHCTWATIGGFFVATFSAVSYVYLISFLRFIVHRKSDR